MEHILHDPTFWVATAFIAFLGVLVYFKVPGMVSGALDERADKIKADIEEAERLREEAQKLLAKKGAHPFGQPPFQGTDHRQGP